MMIRKLPKKVASEQDFYNNVSQKGWTTSEPTEVKMILVHLKRL